MIVKNTTPIPTAKLKLLLEFAAQGIDDRCVEVHVKNSSRTSLRGVAYSSIPSIANVSPGVRYLVTLGMPRKPQSFPNKAWTNVKRIKRLWADSIPLDSIEDDIILYAAHEFRHIWQFQRTERTGKRGKGEYDADKHAFKILNRWREATDREPVQPIKQLNPFGKPEQSRPQTSSIAGAIPSSEEDIVADVLEADRENQRIWDWMVKRLSHLNEQYLRIDGLRVYFGEEIKNAIGLEALSLPLVVTLYLDERDKKKLVVRVIPFPSNLFPIYKKHAISQYSDSANRSIIKKYFINKSREKSIDEKYRLHLPKELAVKADILSDTYVSIRPNQSWLEISHADNEDEEFWEAIKTLQDG